MSSHTPLQKFTITKTHRNKLNKHRSLLIWFTGLSGAGKSTLANALEKKLYDQSIKTFLLDGDNIRNGINKGLEFSIKDRNENLRIVAEIAKLMLDAGLVVIGSFVSPLHSQRKKIQEIVGKENYFEVFMDIPIEICKQRDTKGLYKLSEKKEITNFTGVSQKYEVPIKPNIKILSTHSIEQATEIIYEKIIQLL